MGRPVQATAAFIAAAALAAAQSSSTASVWPYQSFVSEPTFRPPIIDLARKGDTAPGHIVFAQSGDAGAQEAAMIMSEDGELLWQSDPTASSAATANLTPCRLFGRDVLLYWTGTQVQARGDSYGTVTIVDDAYEFLYNVTLDDPGLRMYGRYDSLLDSHEAFVTSRNTLLALAYDPVPWDLSDVGGPAEGWLRDGVLYEIDVETGEILFSWRASSAIPITDSRCPMDSTRSGFGNSSDSAWDYVHLNSATEFGDGFVVSSRHTFEAIYINKNTGNVTWRLQGEHGGDFALEPATTFRWQHDIRLQQKGGELLMSLHDNQNNYTPPYNATAGNLMRVDEAARTVAPVRIFQDPDERVQASSGGSFQSMDNGNAFVYFGSQPVAKEFDAAGAIALTYRFGPADSPTGPGVGAYRAYKWEWKGYPNTKPAVSACNSTNGTMVVYMSWNGATEVDNWKVYTGASDSGLDLIPKEVRKTGFETSTTVPAAGFIQVEAVGGCRRKSDTRRSTIVAVEKAC